jgi:hypothetical protein
MKLLKGLGIGLCLIVLCLLVAPKTKANGLDSKTAVTFVVPVEVPGLTAQTLPAGTYLFKVVDSSPDRDIIQVSSQDGAKVLATFLGVPNPRLKASDLTVTMFGNRPAADSQALETWYGPGRGWGDQIVYEKSRAAQLAKEANEPVLSTSAVLALSTVDTLKTAPIEAVNPGGETVAIAQVINPPATVAPAVAVAAGPAVAVVAPPAAVTTVAVAPAPAAAPAAAPAPVAAAAPPAPPAPTVTPEPTVAAAPVVETAPAATVQTTVVAPAPTAAVAPTATTAPAVTAAPTPAVAPTVAAAPEVATATLPDTASVLPLVGLVGLLMLGAGFLLTNLLKRRA